MSRNKVFISYSHKDPNWLAELRTMFAGVKLDGRLDVWADTDIPTGSKWRLEIQRALESAHAAVLLVSGSFMASRFISEVELPRLLEAQQTKGLKLFALKVEPCPLRVHALNEIQFFHATDKSLSQLSEPDQKEILAKVVEEIVTLLNPVPMPSDLALAIPNYATGLKIDITRLPEVDYDIVGRETELETLTKAWNDPEVCLLSVIAMGGTGKTALTNRWVQDLKRQQWGGAKRAFVWSFYSQGSSAIRQVSSSEFFAEAGKFFEVMLTDASGKSLSDWDKGHRLGEALHRQRTLLVLDGLEPLQEPPGTPLEGHLKDQALKSLFRTLAGGQGCLCLITTRIAVADLAPIAKTAHQELELDQLSDQAGATLLRRLLLPKKASLKQQKTVETTKDKELQEASHEFGGHALALRLLGTWLATAHEGDIRHYKQIGALGDRDAGHAQRVMLKYEQWYAGKVELDILHLLGLFDRPAEPEVIAVLRQKPVIAGLTERLATLPEAEWQHALTALRQAGLLLEEAAGELDAHPLVREYFGQRLREGQPEAWQAAHERLYEYFKKQPEKVLPDTLEEMEPLVRAVHHGCQAGHYQAALDDVYRARIRRGSEAYLLHKLGAFSVDLGVVAEFFVEPWTKPVGALREHARAWLLNTAGFDLRALGRLNEALAPMRAALGMGVQAKDWKAAATRASNLSELSLSVGRVSDAVKYGEESVRHADESKDEFQRMGFRTTWADALHKAGDIEKAKELFIEAEKIQKARQPGYPLLYSVQGYRYCDLLLGQGEWAEVKRRAKQTLEWVTKAGWLLDMSLDHLSWGRALVQEAVAEAGSGKAGKAAERKLPPTWNFARQLSEKVSAILKEAHLHLDHAVEGLRRGSRSDYLPRALLARAEYYRLTGEFSSAKRDLDEAYELADRCGMKLFETDCHLSYARLALTPGGAPFALLPAREHLAKAAQLIASTGYRRRDAELKSLQALVK